MGEERNGGAGTAISGRVGESASPDRAKYDPQAVEAKWQKRWAEAKVFETEADPSKPKYYVLEMLPYPSGTLHMGHMRNYTIGDVVARVKRMKGFNVIHPMGWDAFGLPAENAAIKNKTHPRTWTNNNIAEFQRVLRRFGFSYDWRREISTCEPEYYRWNQWFFLRMLEKGLAYRKEPGELVSEVLHSFGERAGGERILLAARRYVGGVARDCAVVSEDDGVCGSVAG